MIWALKLDGSDWTGHQLSGHFVLTIKEGMGNGPE